MRFPGVKALTFDIGGTVFDWRGTIEDEVTALAAKKGVKLDVRQFATDWRSQMFQMLGQVKNGEIPRMNADEIHRLVLDNILETHNTFPLTTEERDELNLIWHRMNTWSDAVEAIHKLREHYSTHVLTVMSFAIAVDCSKYNGLSWDGILSCEFLEKYKTDARAYEQAAELLGLAPDEVMMVAAHTMDLKGAKDAGMRTAYVAREDDWHRVYPTDEPVIPLENFDVAASDFDDLVKKLT